MIRFTLNGKIYGFEGPENTPLLWVLRDGAGLTGTKYSCGLAQCGYCQSGQIMAVAAMLRSLPSPTDKDIDRKHSNICRCGTYSRIRKAIHRAAELSREGSGDE